MIDDRSILAALRGARRQVGGVGSVSPPPPPPSPLPPAAVFGGSDTTTQGAWVGVHGSKGFIITDKSGGTIQAPTGFTLTPSGELFTSFGSYSVPAAEPQEPSGATTFLGVFFSETSQLLDIVPADHFTHYTVWVYMADADGSRGSNQTISMTDGSGALLDGPRAMPTFTGGIYNLYTCVNHVQVHVSYSGGVANAIYQGVFFD